MTSECVGKMYENWRNPHSFSVLHRTFLIYIWISVHYHILKIPNVILQDAAMVWIPVETSLQPTFKITVTDFSKLGNRLPIMLHTIKCFYFHKVKLQLYELLGSFHCCKLHFQNHSCNSVLNTGLVLSLLLCCIIHGKVVCHFISRARFCAVKKDLTSGLKWIYGLSAQESFWYIQWEWLN